MWLLSETERVNHSSVTDDVIVDAISKWLAQEKLRARREAQRKEKTEASISQTNVEDDEDSG
jgi:hypothetical protein